jgi:hypothetical protein
MSPGTQRPYLVAALWSALVASAGVGMLYLSVVRSEQNGYRMSAPQWTLATTGAVVLGPGAMIMWRFRWHSGWQSGDDPVREIAPERVHGIVRYAFPLWVTAAWSWLFYFAVLALYLNLRGMRNGKAAA